MLKTTKSSVTFYKKKYFYPQINEHLTYICSDQDLCAVLFDIDFESTKINGKKVSEISCHEQETALLTEVHKQMTEYMNKQRVDFDLPLYFKGTDFQIKIWQALQKISYGKTQTYKEIAVLLNSPLAVRAVGASIGKNPLPIVIPCHRVIASNGKLQGFLGGLNLKAKLLELENKQP